MINRMSRIIHDGLLDKLCSAPLSFFESTPNGRLLNVIGQDIWRIDSEAASEIGREC